MGSGRGDRNQGAADQRAGDVAAAAEASMGSGRSDRNQLINPVGSTVAMSLLQWGPVVVTGIRFGIHRERGRRTEASMGSGRGDRNQAGYSRETRGEGLVASMGSGRGDRNQLAGWLFFSLSL